MKFVLQIETDSPAELAQVANTLMAGGVEAAPVAAPIPATEAAAPVVAPAPAPVPTPAVMPGVPAPTPAAPVAGAVSYDMVKDAIATYVGKSSAAQLRTLLEQRYGVKAGKDINPDHYADAAAFIAEQAAALP